jgi:diphthamide synthase (EF-2-diphthine--ammonia ligase)
MVAAGLRARITCVNPKRLDPSFAGRVFDQSFIDDLPPAVDPCGENGEFHSFAFAGPMFPAPIEHRLGEIVDREGFTFADVELGPAPAIQHLSQVR